MIRIAWIIASLVLSTACGSLQSRSGSAPPAATATTAAHTTRLALSTYCRSAPGVTGCADGADPFTVPGLPVIRARRGATIVIRLGFDPTKRVQVSIGRHRHLRLDPARELRIRIDRPGVLQLVAEHGPDDVSYVARIRLAA